jgi:hypothetical protein
MTLATLMQGKKFILEHLALALLVGVEPVDRNEMSCSVKRSGSCEEPSIVRQSRLGWRFGVTLRLP